MYECYGVHRGIFCHFLVKMLIDVFFTQSKSVEFFFAEVVVISIYFNVFMFNDPEKDHPVER